MRPVTESLGYLDISSGASEDFNKLIKTIGYDITKVFNMANENEKATEQNMSVVVQENLFLQRKVHELENTIASIQQTLGNRSISSRYSYLYKTFYTLDSVDMPQGEILHDAAYGVLTLPYSNNNKIPILKHPKEFLQKTLDIQVVINGETITMIDDPSLINIVDGDEGTFWVTTVKTGTNINSVDISVTINLPVKILPNLSINSIGIKPHPLYSMSLNDITYVNAANGTGYRLPTFPVSDNNPVPLQGIDNTKFVFPTIVTNSMTFSFTQPYYIQSGDVRTFVIGLRNIDLESLNVTVGEASFVTEFKVPGDDKYFGAILEPEIITLNNEDYTDAVVHELFYDKTSTAPFVFGSTIAADIDTVYIKTTIRRAGDIIPALKGMRLKYLSK